MRPLHIGCNFASRIQQRFVMTPNAFIGKTKQPTDGELTTALGPARATWDQLLADLDREFGVNIREWNSYSPKAGWSLRVKRKARTIVWLGPRESCFIAALVLGDKAMRAARAGKLPQRIVNHGRSAEVSGRNRGPH